MTKPTIILVTMCNLSLLRDPLQVNGSVLWTRNLLECLAQVAEVNTAVVSLSSDGDGVENDRFVRALGMDHVSVPFRNIASQSNASRGGIANLLLELWGLVLDKYFFLAERGIRRERHLDRAVREIVQQRHPGLVVFDHVYPTFCLPSVFSLGVPCALISVNNEIPFHRTTKAQAGPVGEGVFERIQRGIYQHGNGLSNWRFESYMRRLYRRCVGIVVLNRGDLPKDLPESIIQAAIPPVFRKCDRPWRYQASHSLFFVGNIRIYSNRAAIEWICTRFAPELMKINPSIRINIIGARRDQVPGSWPKVNTIFMGQADGEEVGRQMSGADLFLAPIENPFGAKLKMAECVSHATPFLATYAAMSGLAFRDEMPQIDLARPSVAAQLAADYIGRPQVLRALSLSIEAHAQEARRVQIAAWGNFLRRCLERQVSDGIRSSRFTVSSRASEEGGSLLKM